MKTREYTIEFAQDEFVQDSLDTATVIDAQVHYHLLDEARRQRIGYQNKQPIHYPVFQQQIGLGETALSP